MPPTETQPPFPEHYNVRRVYLNVELEPYDPVTGRMLMPVPLTPVLVPESEFGRALADLLTSRGLSPANFGSTEKKP
jgi:hypothetical protein